MNRTGMIIIVISSALIIGAVSPGASADTILKTDGKEIRGVVVEEYKDRLVFSTVDGEIDVMKSEIKRVSLDDEESNLLKLAANAKDNDDLARAGAYYEKVLAINPRSKAAKEGASFIKLQSWQKEKKRKLADLEKQAEIDMYGSARPAADARGSDLEEMKDRLEKQMGISLGSEGNLPVVTRVKAETPASIAGIDRGDRLVSTWGKLTGYMSFKEVVDLLLNKSSMEVRCTIERTVDLPVSRIRTTLTSADLIGASLDIGPEGLALFTVKPGGSAEKAGLMKGDLIVSIDGVPTRYLQLGKAINLIKRSKGNSVKIVFRRDVVIWKGGV